MPCLKKNVVLILMILSIVPIARAEDIAYKEKEIIRNGNFKNGTTAWHERACYPLSVYIGNESGMAMGNLDAPRSYFFQQLIVPSELQSAALRFDWRAVEKGHRDINPTNFQVAIATSKGFDTTALYEDGMETPPLDILGDLHSEKIEAASDWKEFSATLDPSLISKMQEAHDAGEFIFLLLSQTDSDTGYNRHYFDLNIDNISLKVDGVQHVPEMHGKIAYLEVNDDERPFAIGILDPNTRTTSTLWTHPDGEFGHYSNLAWKPDATELTFISDHNFQFSLFDQANIYSIKPDGSGLHPIPNVPTGGDAENGDFPLVTVSGSIHVVAEDPLQTYYIIMGIEGTAAGKAFFAGSGETVQFTISDVPVLDAPTVLDQAFIITYSSQSCGTGRGFAFATAPVTNGTVNVGTVNFVVPPCTGIHTFSCPGGLAWTRDGSKLGFMMSTAMWTIDPATTDRFDFSQLDPPGGGNLSDNLAWSPVDDRYLYEDWSWSNGGTELYLAEEGGEPQVLVSASELGDATPVWLPDGSGFVYVGSPKTEIDYILYQYDLASGQKKRLTYFIDEKIRHLAISPDGRHIVMQICPDGKRSSCNLWMLDRTNPVQVWPVTESGHCIYPDWSRVDVPSPDNGGGGGGGGGGNDTPDDSSGSGGGGGCFISSTVR